MAKKTVKLNLNGIQSLPDDKPVVYKVLSRRGDNIYTGVAKKGNVQDRLEDHMPGHRDAVPGAAKVQITSSQVSGLPSARRATLFRGRSRSPISKESSDSRVWMNASRSQIIRRTVRHCGGDRAHDGGHPTPHWPAA